MAMDGKQILALVDTGSGTYEPMGEQTGLSWENSTNLIEVSSKDSGHTKWVAGKRDGTVSLEAFYVPNDTAYQAFKDAQKNGEPIILRRSEDGTEVEEAEAFVSTISGDAPDNDGATVSIDFQLNEDWAEVTAV